MSSANSSSNSLPTTDPANRTQSRGSNNDSNGINIRMVPNLGIGSRCFVFDIIERTIPPGVVFKIGRYSDRNIADDRLSFKSKVVSRNHAELWSEEDNKIFIRDVGSSSGTFVNRARLSPAGISSAPQEIKDGDLVQLGVDYQGGIETMFRAVRMRVELNREPPTVSQPFSRAAFQQLRQHLLTTVDHIQECCICLYAIAPLQALFISPCSHIFHFKCLRPLLFQNYPGFSCPICRSYSDLEASVAIEVRDLVEIMGENQDKDKPDKAADSTDDDHASDIGGEELHPTTTNVEPEPSQEETNDNHGVPLPSTTTTTNNNNNNQSRSAAHQMLSSAARGAAELSSTLVATPPNLDAVMSAGTSPL
ncbi:hypothetical protein K492DRAFT_167474 [Lichtheimia hyalospora FSU 10163]|nr:hypothetical protein K492DRAFT_167474 [Lichtheimia hyalospora FSU 10163]